jgi:nucleotide-binding universal stress UspA family protein
MLVERRSPCRSDGGAMTDRIAVGVDGTAASRAALEWAVRLAVRENWSVVLLHVAGNTSEAARESDSLVQEELDFARTIAPDISITFEVHHGETVKVLAHEAHWFALLVIGTHKTGFLRGRAFGSTSLHLAATCAAPLAVIPIASGRSRRGVLVGIDDELHAMSAIRRGANEAIRSHSELTLIYASKTDTHSPIPAALELLAREYPGLPVRARDVFGLAGEVLTNAATTAELLYIGGTSASTGLGAVGYDVLLNISGPTILVPTARESAAASA